MNNSVSSIALEEKPGKRGHAMTTFTGREFWPLDPRPDDMLIIDVAHHLAMQVRFNGAVKDFYSVAEHCVLGSHIVYFLAMLSGATEKEAKLLAFEFLMHDAWETWAGDMIRPIKNGTACGAEFKKLERPGEAAVRIRWNLMVPTPPIIKQVDSEMCAVEQRQRYESPLDAQWTNMVHPQVKLQFWPWQQAKAEFLRRYSDLTGEVVS